jgi:hypothetical protein
LDCWFLSFAELLALLGVKNVGTSRRVCTALLLAVFRNQDGCINGCIMHQGLASSSGRLHQRLHHAPGRGSQARGRQLTILEGTSTSSPNFEARNRGCSTHSAAKMQLPRPIRPNVIELQVTQMQK